MSGKFLSLVALLAHMTVSFCRADVRLARMEGNELSLTVLDDEGNTKSVVTCAPQLPNGSRLDFNQVGKGILIELGVTNQISPQTASIIANLTSTYHLDLLGLPGILLSNKVEYAVRNSRGDKIAVLMEGKGQLHIIDNDFKVLGTIEGKGIQRPAWSFVSDKLAYWQRGTNTDASIDNFSLKAARVRAADVSVVAIAPPSGGVQTRWEHEPPIWNAEADTFWCYPFTNFYPQSHIISMTDNRVTTNELPAIRQVVGAVPSSPCWTVIISRKKGVHLASSQGEIISELGPSRSVYLAISTNLFLTSEIGPPPKNLKVSKPGWHDVGSIPFAKYWLINSAHSP